MKVKIKRLHKDAKISRAHQGDAGWDLTAVSCSIDSMGNMVYGTGLAFAIPEGYVGLIFPRSSVSKQTMSMSNCVGVIDSGYRGEVLVKFKPTLKFQWGENVIPRHPLFYEIGDRIAQMIIIPYPEIEYEEVEELDSTERGEGGYGSTGR